MLTCTGGLADLYLLVCMVAALAGPFMFHHIDSTSAYVGLPGKPDADEGK